MHEGGPRRPHPSGGGQQPREPDAHDVHAVIAKRTDELSGVVGDPVVTRIGSALHHGDPHAADFPGRPGRNPRVASRS